MYIVYKRKDNVEYFVKFEGGMPRFTLHCDEATRLNYEDAARELDVLRSISGDYKSFCMKLMRSEK